MCITQLCLCTVLASLKYSSYLQNEVTKHQTATFSFFNLQDVNLSWTILVLSTSWSLVMSPCLIGLWLVLLQYLIYLLTSSVFALHVTIYRGITCGSGHNCFFYFHSAAVYIHTSTVQCYTRSTYSFYWTNKVYELPIMDAFHSVDILETLFY